MPRRYRPAIHGTLLLFLLSGPLQAQEYSHDGNRWYEVEVSIFTNDFPPGEHTEIAVPEKFSAAYLSRVQKLLPRTASLAVDFPGELLPSSPDQSRLPPANDVLTPAEPPVQMGPLYSPAVADSFHLLDVDRDPYVDLDARFAQFTAMNRNIDSSPDHRLLWHEVWRQPMQGRGQAPAVFIQGGDVRGTHSELEGSLRLSDSSGNVMLDINVWLTRFVFGQPAPDAEWQLPARPFPVPTDAEDSRAPAAGPVQVERAARPDWSASEVWQLELSRELAANQLVYLDNPALGVLIQIRPYVLPPGQTAGEGEDF